MNHGSKVLVQALLQPSQHARITILEQLSLSDVSCGLELVDEMLQTATVLQRGALQDIICRLLALKAEDGLHRLFRDAQQDPDYPRRHLPWFSTILDIHLAQNEIEDFLSIDDSDAVLPLAFHLWEDNRWNKDTAAVMKANRRERVRLWGDYLSDVYQGIDRKRAPYPLLELNNLEDTFVNEWVEDQLESGYYDANILAVCIEREDNRYFEPLWRAVWANPKHKELSLRALTVTAPHVPTPVHILLERIASEAMPHQERQRIAHTLARSFSKLAFLRAQELCKSPIPQRRMIGIDILEYFGSPWHNSRDACVECLLSMLNDPESSIRARAVEAITSSERKKLAKLNPTKLLSGDAPSTADSGWGMLVEELYYAADYKPLRDDIWGEISVETTKATYRPQDVASKTSPKPSKLRPEPEQASNTEAMQKDLHVAQEGTAARRKVIFSSKYAYTAIVPFLLVVGVLMYGVMPRETKGVATVMSTPILKGSSAVLGARQFFEDIDLEDDKTVRSKAELEGAMQIPHAAIMLKRSKCWYLYHRLRPIDSAQYIATAPVPDSDEDPMWKIYDTWLLGFIGTEMANGVFDRVGEFVMTIAMVNPPLANQLVPKVLDRATLLDVDSVAKALVKGGAIDLEQPIVHPALSELDAKVIDELRDALLTGWKTDEDRVLAKYLQDL